jgi:hypothetical protein
MVRFSAGEMDDSHSAMCLTSFLSYPDYYSRIPLKAKEQKNAPDNHRAHFSNTFLFEKT